MTAPHDEFSAGWDAGRQLLGRLGLHQRTGIRIDVGLPGFLAGLEYAGSTADCDGCTKAIREIVKASQGAPPNVRTLEFTITRNHVTGQHDIEGRVLR